ncbi:unnamed protein product [Adineta steineri]|uniref:Uncharacterized protein n=1 Tax=Adineta steineri TaxID=433720 RepID=A0A818ICU7_9BILA|nr:unnamed protein product [Adineta steineri]CAF3522416.1 unnamed protein product [Adineta steineri]
MQRNTLRTYFILIFTSLLIKSTHSIILTNLCSGTSCNCTLTDYIDLEIICDPVINITEIPILINNTLQINVTQLRVASSISGMRGPLTVLPVNISISYPNIAILDLSFNMISGFLNTSKLESLGLNLIQVDFSNNFITDIDINFFNGNRNIQSINFSQNNLTTMPMIDAKVFLNFSTTIQSMNFSYNQITDVDLWPLFVKTQNTMTIDLSHNLIQNYTNKIPLSLSQFTETPDPRYFYLNDNQIERISDLLLEQYGACETSSFLGIAYFVVGISNLLVTNNPLICDCQSYYLITYINDQINDFPEINHRTALLTQATCTSPSSTVGQKYIFSNFTESNACINYTLPDITDIFCSVYANETITTLSLPTYWPTTITTTTTTSTTGINGNLTTTNSEGGNNSSNNQANSSSNSTSPSWYIILGIVLGLALIIFLIVLSIFLCKDRLLPKHFRSKLLNNRNNNLNNSYEPMNPSSEASSQKLFPLHGIQPRRASLATSTDGQDNRMLQLGNNGSAYLNHTSQNDHHDYPNQETQTSFQITRSKPPPGPKRDSQRNLPKNSNRKRQSSPLQLNSVATNTANGIKGIPISSVSLKISPSNSNTSELNVTSIPLVPSKRAKILPQVKNGVYVDSKNTNLLNTSASAVITNERQRRRSSLWLRRQYQNKITPPPVRPQSMVTKKTDFNQEKSTNEIDTSIPTMESLTKKSSKPTRTLPLLNITVVPAWIDDNIDKQ